MCNCVNIEIASKECFSQMILVDIPDHMKAYREARIKQGLSESTCIDPCIFEEIKYLWSEGIVTYGSCCGHNKLESFVNVDSSSIDKMLSMGYVQNHSDKNRNDTFRMKSA